MQSFCNTLHASSKEIRTNVFTSERNGVFFNLSVKLLISYIEKNPIGARLLEKIRLCSSSIYIVHAEENKTEQIREESDDPVKIPVVIYFNLKELTCFSPKGETIALPNYVILVHELIHAYHFLTGKYAKSHLTDPIVWESDEEYKTIIGFPSKKGKTTPKITENAFREAEGLPARFGSYSPSSCHVSLSESRLKVLGRIHEKNQQDILPSRTPPSLALCSIKDLLESRTIFLCKIRGVDVDCNIQEGRLSFFYIIFPDSSSSDSYIGENCYLDLTDKSNRDSEEIIEREENARNLVVSVYPKLKEIVFKVDVLFLLRVSKEELNIIQLL